MKAKSTRERIRLMTILAYLHFYPGSEGAGGKASWWDNSGNWWPGTRLRSPHAPFHWMLRSERNRHMNILLSHDLVTVNEVDGAAHYTVTQKGLDLLSSRRERLCFYIGWYKWGNGIVWKSRYMVYSIPEDAVKYVNSCNSPGSNSGAYMSRIHDYKDIKPAPNIHDLESLGEEEFKKLIEEGYVRPGKKVK